METTALKLPFEVICIGSETKLESRVVANNLDPLFPCIFLQPFQTLSGLFKFVKASPRWWWMVESAAAAAAAGSGNFFSREWR